MLNDESDATGGMGPIRIRTAEGCGYPCMLCGMAKGPLRATARTPEQVVAHVRACGASSVILEVCCMASPPSHAENILRALLSAGDLAGRVRFQAALRPDRLTEGVAEALRALNVEMVTLWCLSGSNHEVRELSGGSMSLADVERALLTCRKCSLPVHAFLFKGAADAGRAELSDTYEWVLQAVKRRLLRAVTVDLLLPWPGTTHFDDALARGIVTPSTTAEEVRLRWQRFYLPRNLPQEDLLCYDLLTPHIRKFLEEGKKRTACVLAGQAAADRARVTRLARNTYFDEMVVLACDLPSGEERWDVGGHLGAVRVLKYDEKAPADVPLLGELAARGVEVIYWLTGDEGPEDAAQALAWDHVMSGSDCTTWLDDAQGKRGILLSAKAARSLSGPPAALEGRLSIQCLSAKGLAVRRCGSHRNVFLGRPMAERILHSEMERQWGLLPGETPFAASASAGAPSEEIRLRDMLIRAQQRELLRLATEMRKMKQDNARRGPPAPKEETEP